MVSLEQEWRSGNCFSCCPLASPRVLSLLVPELENSTAKRVGHMKRQDGMGRVSDHLLHRESWVFIGNTDVEAETPIFWPPDERRGLI